MLEKFVNQTDGSGDDEMKKIYHLANIGIADIDLFEYTNFEMRAK
jgi:hypothetical protein